MASGDTLVVFGATDNTPPATNYAQFAVRNLHPVLAFDKTTGETAIFTGIMPRHYAGGGVTVYLHWTANTVTSGTVGWLVDFERMNTDLDADSFTGSPNTVTAATVNGTSGIMSVTNTTFTNGADMDSVAVGEAFRLSVTRDVANDNADNDAELHMIEIKET